MEQHVMWVFLFLLRCVHWVHSVADGDGLLSPKGVNYEVAALMSVKREMIDGRHVMEGWDINSVDPCTWNMVACSAEGFVISLEMASTGLSGMLSPSIGNLTHLRTMLLQNNQLSGPIPDEIGKLSELQTLDLSGNQFVGAIPSSLGSLTHLSYLRLCNNNFSGLIPRDVANLTGLLFLDLSFNNLSGPTPKILANDYSITGNNFLFTSSSDHICGGVSNPLNVAGSVSSSRVRVNHHWLLSVVIGIISSFVVSVMLLVCWVHWYRSRISLLSYVQQDYDFEIGHLKRFSYRELQIATGNFNPQNILGQGGYGVVYKGRLPNSLVVAVKRLKDPNFTGEVQFQTEVEMIGLALHRNLLRLYGFCMTPDERLLVYPYMPNRSVADCLRDSCHGKPTLNWNRRMHIALGAARGLLYLHEQYDGNGHIQKGMILNWVKTLHEEKRLEALVDRDLKGCFKAIELETITDLALKCTRSQPHLRPKMSEVSKVLEGLVQFGTDEPQGRTNHCETRAYSFARNHSNVREESSFIIEAVELSGPR
ncbi:hypothetical protein GQ457_14G009130 [Hibiscus cannabinus]